MPLLLVLCVLLALARLCRQSFNNLAPCARPVGVHAGCDGVLLPADLVGLLLCWRNDRVRQAVAEGLGLLVRGIIP